MVPQPDRLIAFTDIQAGADTSRALPVSVLPTRLDLAHIDYESKADRLPPLIHVECRSERRKDASGRREQVLESVRLGIDRVG